MPLETLLSSVGVSPLLDLVATSLRKESGSGTVMSAHLLT